MNIIDSLYSWLVWARVKHLCVTASPRAFQLSTFPNALYGFFTGRMHWITPQNLGNVPSDVPASMTQRVRDITDASPCKDCVHLQLRWRGVAVAKDAGFFTSCEAQSRQNKTLSLVIFTCFLGARRNSEGGTSWSHELVCEHHLFTVTDHYSCDYASHHPPPFFSLPRASRIFPY